MDTPMIQLIVLAAIALFLILRLKNVLGTRDGFEGPSRSERLAQQRAEKSSAAEKNFEVIEGGPDHDITDHVPEHSDTAKALAAMKRKDPAFSVNEFLQGARGAYEMILIAFERGNMDEISSLLSPEVRDSFAQVIQSREENGLTVEAEFLGIHQMSLANAQYDEVTGVAEITVRYVGELSSVVRNSDGEIVEGTPGQAKRQKDSWTFERLMSSDDPNWRLVATCE